MTDTFVASPALHKNALDLPPEPPADLRFGPAPGNTMSPPWAAHMLTLWFQAADKRITFADAVRSTAVHFMVDGES